jgi:putative endonuclease
MRMDKIEQGKRGEEFAASYLRRHGYQVIGRNFRIRGGEVDIIALDVNDGVRTLVFVEVKTRTSDDFGTPFEAIGYYKIKTLIRAAYMYKAKHPGLPGLMRIDAVAVVVDKNYQLLTIELVKNIS